MENRPSRRQFLGLLKDTAMVLPIAAVLGCRTLEGPSMSVEQYNLEFDQIYERIRSNQPDSGNLEVDFSNLEEYDILEVAKDLRMPDNYNGKDEEGDLVAEKGARTLIINQINKKTGKINAVVFSSWPEGTVAYYNGKKTEFSPNGRAAAINKAKELLRFSNYPPTRPNPIRQSGSI